MFLVTLDCLDFSQESRRQKSFTEDANHDANAMNKRKMYKPAWVTGRSE